MSQHTTFILSPANTSGRRADSLLRGTSDHPIARALNDSAGASIGDVFTYLSQLYFRGKRTYAEAFTNPRDGDAGVLVILPGHGLQDINTPITQADLRAIASVPIDSREPRYANPLVRDVERMKAKLTGEDRVVFLGSVATDKYLTILEAGLARRLYIPSQFPGLGSMSRGALLLNSVATLTELTYIRPEGSSKDGHLAVEAIHSCMK